MGWAGRFFFPVPSSTLYLYLKPSLTIDWKELNAILFTSIWNVTLLLDTSLISASCPCSKMWVKSHLYTCNFRISRHLCKAKILLYPAQVILQNYIYKHDIKSNFLSLVITLILFVTHLRVLTCRVLSLTVNSGSGCNVTDANEDDTTQILKAEMLGKVLLSPYCTLWKINFVENQVKFWGVQVPCAWP